LCAARCAEFGAARCAEFGAARCAEFGAARCAEKRAGTGAGERAVKALARISDRRQWVIKFDMTGLVRVVMTNHTPQAYAAVECGTMLAGGWSSGQSTAVHLGILDSDREAVAAINRGSKTPGTEGVQ